MRFHDERGVLGACDRDGDGRRQAAAGATTVDDLAKGAEVHGFTLHGLDESLLELRRADHIEQLKQSGSRASDVFVALGDGSEKGLAARRGPCQAIETSVLAGVALGLDEPLQVLLVLDLLTAIPRAPVSGDHLGDIGDPNLIQICENDQGALCPVVRNRIVVEIEANVGRLADLNLETLVRGKRVVGQRQQDAALVVESLTHRAYAVLDPGALESCGGGPVRRLMIEVGQVGIRPGREERLAHVANGPLDATLFIAPSHIDGTWLESVASSQVKQLRIEANRVAVTLEHGTSEIVVQQDTRHAPELGERLDVTTHEEGHGRAEVEAKKEPPGVAEHHDERPEGAYRSTNLQLAEVRPIDLGLLARQSAQALERLGRLLRTKATHDASQVIGASWIAALLDHAEDAARGQLRVLLELLDDEGDERIDHRWARRDDLRIDARLSKHALYRGVMETQLASDRADRPLLSMVEAHDLRLGLVRHHGHLRSSRRPLRQARRASSSCAGTRTAASSPCPPGQRCSAKRTPTEA